MTNTYPLQPLWNIAEICASHGIKNAVLSPGSRCAPLVHGFTNHPEIECFTVTDERSAGFIAMGIAQQTNQPVVLICTSGTAGVNYFSAIAEAFYQDIPLLVLTADRPPELLDQQDGQTIHQREIFGKHVRKSLQLPDDFLHEDKIWHAERIVNEAINLCFDFPKKPVHINVPIREPFYPKANEKVTYKKAIKLIEKENFEQVLSENTIQKLQEQIRNSAKILVIAGQDDLNPELCQLLSKLHIPVISDIITNTHSVSNSIRHQDFTLINKNFKDKIGKPDLVITFSKSLISKNLKLFLREYQPLQHWHIQKSGYSADTFKSLTKVIPVSALYFFKAVFTEITTKGIEIERQKYTQIWQGMDKKFGSSLVSFLKNYEFSEPKIIFDILQNMPNDSNLHLSNSMTVRYANVFNFTNRSESNDLIRVFANRGTSGIDGSTSTAVGHSLVSEKLQFLITGDLAFFYDRNALWNNYLPKNLRIILLNNQGGGIFNMIPGPRSIPSSETYFLTPHTNHAQYLCADFGVNYSKAETTQDLEDKLADFFEDNNQPQLLECRTDYELNRKIWSELKQLVMNLI